MRRRLILWIARFKSRRLSDQTVRFRRAIVAQYAGTAIFAASSDSLRQDVDLYPTSTILTTNPNPSTFGANVTLTAKVTSQVGIPAGTITFRDVLSVLATMTLDSTGTATWTTNSFSGGLHLLTATFNGGTTLSFSISNIVVQVVNPAATSTKLVSSVNPSSSGQKVTFTTTVTSAAGTPGGTVVFSDGSNVLGSASLASNGQASLSTSSLHSGTHSITVQYEGNLNYQSSSATLSQAVH